MIAFAGAVAMAAACALAGVRVFAGPTHYDRALACAAVTSKAALACAALALAAGRAQWLDAALALALGGFVANAAVMKFFRYRGFQAPASRGEAGAP